MAPRDDGKGQCRCGRRWGGLAKAHCTVCHSTFTSRSSFDMHRRGPADNRRCELDKLAEVRPGIWGRPGADARWS